MIEQILQNFHQEGYTKDIYKELRIRFANVNHRFLEGILTSFIFSISENEVYNFGEKLFNDIYEYMISDTFKKMKNIYIKTNNLFELMKDRCSVDVSVDVNRYQNLLGLFYEAEWKPENDIIVQSLNIPLLYQDEKGNVHYRIKEFLKTYSDIGLKNPFLRFSWGLSSI